MEIVDDNGTVQSDPLCVLDKWKEELCSLLNPVSNTGNDDEPVPPVAVDDFIDIDARFYSPLTLWRSKVQFFN